MYAEMSLLEISKLPGLNDLNLMCRAKFAQALKAEELGDHVKAEQCLIEAVAKEHE